MIRALSVAVAVVLATALVPQGSASAEAAKKGKSISGKAGTKAAWHESVILGDVAAARKSGGKKKGKKGN